MAATPQPFPPLAGMFELMMEANPNRNVATATHAAEICQPANRSEAWNATKVDATAIAVTADHKDGT